MPTIRKGRPPVRLVDGIAPLYFGPFVRHLRDRAKLTTRELAAKLGTTQRRVLNIERDSRTTDLNLSTLIKYAEAFGEEPGAYLDALLEFARTYKDSDPDEVDEKPARTKKKSAKKRPA